MHFTCRSFSANSESKSWSRFWENESDDPTIKSAKGHLFALINVDTSEDKDLNSIGHDIVYEFNQNYFNTESNQNILANLTQSINSVIKNPLYSDYQIDLLTAVILDDQLFLAIIGNCKAILKRHDQISILIDGFKNQTETISGPIQDQDRLFLLTNSFYEKITWHKIKQFLSDQKIQNVEENFLSAIYSLSDQKDLAAVFIEAESDILQNELIAEDKEQATVLNPITPAPPSKTNFFQKFIKNKSVFVSEHQISSVSKRKKISLIFASILIIIFSLSIYFGYQNNQRQKTESQYQNLKNQLDSQIIEINQTKSLNFDSAQAIATTAQETLLKMQSLKIHSDEVQSYDSQIKSLLSQTGSPNNPVSPDLVYDLGQSAKQSQFQTLIFNNNQLYLLDSQNGQIDSFDITKKTIKNLASSDKIKSSIGLANDKNNLYLMTSTSISLIENGNLTPKIKFDNITPTDFKFWNGAAYVLDNDSQTIFKFTPNATGFSKAQNWIKNDNKLDKNATSVSINGPIWVLYQNGSITPYLSGVKDNFTPNQENQFTQANNLNVGLDKEILVFNDKNIIFVYQKTGELLGKFNLGNLQINDISLNETDNSIYILSSDQKIYSLKY